ncbi:LysR family transcriptional regulator [Kitasatospora sp. NBC_01539]|uniref:LysR family transcriptional regulator n=1 Tax=Kitasatospora sp. NBC_01539 TaxID=2903577 RepID=UPI003860095E
MEIRQLEYVVAIVDEGGFGRAAARLHVVQSAVSRQVARLERELGVRLFDRSTRLVRLTAAGRRLLPEARAVLAAVDRVGRVAAEVAAGADGVLRLSTGRMFADRVYRALDRLAGTAPGLRVTVRQHDREQRIEAVRAGDSDTALVRGPGPYAGLAAAPVWEDPLVVALPAGHPLAERERLRPADLAGIPVRLAPRRRNPAFHDLVTGALRDAGVEPVAGPPFTVLQDTLTALAADAADGAPSWTVFDPVGALPPAGRVAFRPLDGPVSTTSLVVREGPATPAVALLLAALAEAAHPGR